mgnify:CR=1 FL=1
MAKHDVDCVAHTHTPAGMARLGDGMRAASARRRPRCGFSTSAIMTFEGIADNVDERERLVRDLGDNEGHDPCAIMACWWSASTVPAAFNVLFRLRAGLRRAQVMALSCNTRLTYPPQGVPGRHPRADASETRCAPPATASSHGRAPLRKLSDRADPSYRNWGRNETSGLACRRRGYLR